jgi:hypothetical protein
MISTTFLLATLMACSAISEQAPCVHPSCEQHLSVGASKEEVFTDTWAEADWREVMFHGPVGRDFNVFFGFKTITPMAFEDGELYGWAHAFGPESWRLGPRYAKLRYLETGMTLEQIKRFRGEPRRIARFRSASGGEELQIVSWKPSELPLVMVRLVTFRPLEETWQLEETLSLRGYAVGFGDFLAH